jgi:hypothetical protein
MSWANSTITFLMDTSWGNNDAHPKAVVHRTTDQRRRLDYRAIRRAVRVGGRQRLIPARPFCIPAFAQGPHGIVKNLNPF